MIESIGINFSLLKLKVNKLSSYCLIWLNVCVYLIVFNCLLVNGQLTDETTTSSPSQLTNDDKFSPIWSNLIDVTCENGLQTWNSCLNETYDYWSTIKDEDKRDCCASWFLFNCWSYQVKIVCSDIDPTQLEQSRIKLTNQSQCTKYYDLSVCLAKPLPLWANIFILSFGATLITGAAIFVYWRWIRLI